MTTIKISITKDNGWDSEGDALESSEFVWKTDGSQQTQGRIAVDIAKTLRLFTRTPLKAVTFAEVFFDNQPSKEEYNQIKEELSKLHLEAFNNRMAVIRALELITDEALRAQIDGALYPEEKLKADKIKYE